jgi:hypothetical protein
MDPDDFLVREQRAMDTHTAGTSTGNTQGLPIAPVPAELMEPLETLLRAAHLFRAALVHLASGASFEELASTHTFYLLMAERAVDRWAQHLGVDLEEEPNTTESESEERPWTQQK